MTDQIPEPPAPEPKSSEERGPIIKPGFSWRLRPLTPSEEWANKNLGRSPLTQHLTQLHSILLTLGAEGDILMAAEHSLREIDRFTMTTPRRGSW